MKKIVRRSGFTLPEILVTVTVVAVLAAVVVPAVTQYVSKGNGPATQQDLSQLQNAITAFVSDTKVYPEDLSDLSGTTAPLWMTSAQTPLYHGPYLQATVTSGTTTGAGQGASGANFSGSALTGSFTSQGTGLVFTNAIEQANGALYLVVESPSQCGSLATIQKALDNSAGTATTTGVAPTENFTYWGTCGTTTATADSAKYRVATIGS